MSFGLRFRHILQLLVRIYRDFWTSCGLILYMDDPHDENDDLATGTDNSTDARAEGNAS